MKGHVDQLTLDRIEGWAVHEDPARKARVGILVNDQVLGEVVADAYRRDLEQVSADGRCAFRLNLGIESRQLVRYLPASATLRVVDTRTGKTLRGGEATFAGNAENRTGLFANKFGEKFSVSAKYGGGLVIQVRDRNPEWVSAMVRFSRRVADEINRAGAVASIAYGTMLGLVREGALIPHDDDIDLAAVVAPDSKHDAIEAFERLRQSLESTPGYHTIRDSNGQFHVHGKLDDGRDVSVDVFAAWFDAEHFNLTFALRQPSRRDDLLPVEYRKLGDVELPCFRQPEALLAGIYGPNWDTPDPDFRWDIPQPTRKFFASVSNHQLHKNLDYWDKYYRKGREGQGVASPSYPSQFAVFMRDFGVSSHCIVEFGCGNGRDAFFFADNGRRVIGLDYSQAAIEGNLAIAGNGRYPELEFLRCDVGDFADLKKARATIETHRQGAPMLFYARFFLHAIDGATEAALLEFLDRACGPDDVVALEFRTAMDAGGERTTQPHFRRYLDPMAVINEFTQRAFRVEYFVEGRGFAKYKSDDAYVARLVFRRARPGPA